MISNTMHLAATGNHQATKRIEVHLFYSPEYLLLFMISNQQSQSWHVDEGKVEGEMDCVRYVCDTEW